MHSVVGSLMYVQVCTHLNIVYIVGGIRHIFKQLKNESLENSEKSYKVFTENKMLYVHIQKVKLVKDPNSDFVARQFVTHFRLHFDIS